MSQAYANALDRYTEAIGAVKAHIAANEAVFKAHEGLVGRVIDAENALRDFAAEEKTNISNGTHEVIVTPQKQVFVNPDDLEKLAMSTKVPSPEEMRELIHTEERPPRISIREQGRS